MFAKLLKHEWRGAKSVTAILCAVILGAGAAIGFCGFYLAGITANESLWDVLVVLLMLAAVLAIGICSAGAVLYLLFRFYQRYFTDEGYLTFTLPVTVHQLLLSSILNILRGCLMVILAAMGAMVIAFGILLLAFSGEIVWADYFYAIRQLWPEIWESLRDLLQAHWQDVLTLLGAGVSGGIFSLILLMLSITIGAMLARKHRLLTTVAVYWGIGLVQSVALTWWSFANIENSDVSWFLDFHLFAGIATSVAGYFLMHWLLERKLNLT